MTTRDELPGSKEGLRQRLVALNAEIGAYPGPITGCDAQFNHLLEERVRLNAELAKVDARGDDKNENTGP